MQNLFLCPCFLHLRQQCVLNGHFQAKYQPPHFQQADGGFLCVEPGDVELCCFWTVLTAGLVAGTDCWTICVSCLRFISSWHSYATCWRIMSGFCSIFDRIFVRTIELPADLNPHANMLIKAASSTIFGVFGIIRPRIEPWSPSSLANTLLIRPMTRTYKYKTFKLCVCVRRNFGTYASMLPQKSRTFPSVSGPITERIGIFRKEI